MMGTLATIAAIISIVATIGGTGITVNSVLWNRWLNEQNSSVKQAVRNLISEYNQYFSNNRTALSTALGKLTNKGNAAFQTWVTHNPVLMASAKDFMSGYDEVTRLQSEQSRLENIIAEVQNSLNSLGYTSSRQGVSNEAESKRKYEKQLQDARKDYDELGRKVDQVNFKTVNSNPIDTSKLDAVSQNIIGGLKQ